MAYSLLMVVEGVLATDEPELALSQVVPQGVALFHALRDHFSVALSTVAPVEAAERWLELAGIDLSRQTARLLSGDPGLPVERVRRRHFDTMRSSGGELAYVVDPDPEMARFYLRRGVTPLCCPNPLFARYSFLPDSQAGGAGWDQIVAEINDQRVARRKVETVEPTSDEEDEVVEL